MPFTITATNSGGSTSVKRATAKLALEKVMEFEDCGLQEIAIEDGRGHSLNRDHLIMMALMEL
jgi:hypothetical protein